MCQPGRAGSAASSTSCITRGPTNPETAAAIIDAAPPARQGWEILLDYNYRLNQAFARIYVVASSTAIVLWSAAIVRTRTLASGAGVYGLVMGSVAALAVVSGHVRLDVHGFGLIVLGQALWFIVVGALLLRLRAR